MVARYGSLGSDGELGRVMEGLRVFIFLSYENLKIKIYILIIKPS